MSFSDQKFLEFSSVFYESKIFFKKYQLKFHPKYQCQLYIFGFFTSRIVN